MWENSLKYFFVTSGKNHSFRSGTSFFSRTDWLKSIFDVENRDFGPVGPIAFSFNDR